jgi:hypothetical protein
MHYKINYIEILKQSELCEEIVKDEQKHKNFKFKMNMNFLSTHKCTW